jgi:hypothetical protein
MTRAANRKWPFIMTGITVVAGILYTLFWNELVHHAPVWALGGDVWGVWRAAHYVGWGDPGGIYDPSTGVVTLPGLPVLLSPLAMLSGRLHLSESVSPYFLPHPTAALILQPAELLLGSTVLFASDALAERMGASRSRRVWVCVTVTVVAFSVSAVWGHAEDLLAMTFALYGLKCMFDGGWKAGGWLLGFGVCFQPLVALLIPVCVAMSPMGQRIRTALRASVLPVLLTGIAFRDNPSGTARALLQQPTPPHVNHPTPWIALAPHLRTLGTLSPAAHAVGGRLFPEITVAPGTNVLVSGGPSRTVYLIVAVLIGVAAYRWRPNPTQFLWLVAVVLSLRCYFEAVMTPYYLGPPLIMILVVASIQSNKRFGTAVVVAVETLVLAYNRVSPWAWWIPVVIAMSALLALSRPPSSGESRTSEPPNEDEYDRGATLGQSREPESSLPRDPVAVAG